MIRSDNQKTLYWLVSTVLIMLAASFAAVPFYDWFCRVTGFSGTTQQAETAPVEILDRTMTVRFAASTASDMPWEFRAVDPKIDVRIGETNLVFFEAYNPTDKPITGTASFNVAPFELGQYFSKIECFCFTEQLLQPGERVEMPVTFFVDPDMVKDPDVRDFQSLTLAYTFHLTESEEAITSEDN